MTDARLKNVEEGAFHISYNLRNPTKTSGTGINIS